MLLHRPGTQHSDSATDQTYISQRRLQHATTRGLRVSQIRDMRRIITND